MLIRKPKPVIFIGLGIKAIIVVRVDSVSGLPHALGNVMSTW